MRTTGMRLVAAVVGTSLVVAGLRPVGYAQKQVPPVESTQLEVGEQPMLPTPVPPPPDPAVAQAQPSQPAPVLPAPPGQPLVQQVPAPAPPPPPTAQPSQPDLFQEALKSEARAAGAKQGLYEAGAVLTNFFLVPGRVITCTLGAGVGIVVLAITLGTGYKTAAGAFDEGCGGKWIVTGDDLRPEGSRAFEWER